MIAHGSLRKGEGQDGKSLPCCSTPTQGGSNPLFPPRNSAEYFYPIALSVGASTSGGSCSGFTPKRHWADPRLDCQANLIAIQIDDNPRLQAAYGTIRADTRSVCGDGNHGFGLAWNWNLVGDKELTFPLIL